LTLALLILADENSIFTVATGQGKSLMKLRQYYATSNSLLLLSTAVLWAIVVALAITRLGPTSRAMRRQNAVLSFACIAFLSLLWSQEPQLTFRHGVALLLSLCFASTFATSYTPTDQIRILLLVGLILGLASVVMAVALPRYGLDTGGEWKGVFGQKNHLGHAMLFLFAGLAFCPMRSRKEKCLLLLRSILPLGLIVMSRSMGSLLLAILLIAVRAYGPAIHRARKEQLPFFLYTVVCLILAAIFGRGLIFYLIGKDSTLTGRTHEWSVLMLYAYRHLWLGYGFGAFWNGYGDSLNAMKMIGGAMRGADSGYVDTFLQLGLAGIALWIVSLLAVIRNCANVFQNKAVPLTAYWYVGILLVTYVGSYTDNFFPIAGGIATFIFAVAYVGLLDHKRGSVTRLSPS